MSDVERVAKAQWANGYAKGKRDAQRAMGPQLTPEQAHEARQWILGHRPNRERELYVGRTLDEANRTLALIAERGGTE